MQTARSPQNDVKQRNNMKPSTQDKAEATAKIISGAIKKKIGKILGRP